MKKITLRGVEYPCRLVMGALLLFKRETGKDVAQMDAEALEDVLMLLWCCVKCACQADGVEFKWDFETFCNTITPDEVRQWNEDMMRHEEKKMPKET